MRASSITHNLRQHQKIVKSIDKRQYSRNIASPNKSPSKPSQSKEKVFTSTPVKKKYIQVSVMAPKKSPIVPTKRTDQSPIQPGYRKKQKKISSPSLEDLNVFHLTKQFKMQKNLSLKERVENLSRTLHQNNNNNSSFERTTPKRKKNLNYNTSKKGQMLLDRFMNTSTKQKKKKIEIMNIRQSKPPVSPIEEMRLNLKRKSKEYTGRISQVNSSSRLSLGGRRNNTTTNLNLFPGEMEIDDFTKRSEQSAVELTFNENKELGEAVKRLKEEVSVLRRENKYLQSTNILAGINSGNGLSIHHYKKLESDLADLKIENTQLKEQNDSLVQKLSLNLDWTQNEQKHVLLAIEITRLNNINRDLDENLQKKFKELEDAKDQLTQANENHQKNYQELQETKKNSENKILAENKNLLNEIEKYREISENANQMIKDQNTLLEKCKSQENYIQELTEKIQSNGNSSQGIEEKLTEKELYCQQLENEIQNQKHFSEQLIEKQHSQEKYIQEIEEKLQAWDKNSQENERKLSQEREYSKELTEKFKKNHEEIQELENRLEKSVSYSQKLEEKNQELENKIISSQENSSVEFEEILRNKEEDLSQTREKLNDQEKYSQRLLNDFKGSQVEIARQKKLLAVSNQENEGLKDKINQIEFQFQSMRNEFDSTKKVNEKLSENCSILRNVVYGSTDLFCSALEHFYDKMMIFSKENFEDEFEYFEEKCNWVIHELNNLKANMDKDDPSQIGKLRKEEMLKIQEKFFDNISPLIKKKETKSNNCETKSTQVFPAMWKKINNVNSPVKLTYRVKTLQDTPYTPKKSPSPFKIKLKNDNSPHVGMTTQTPKISIRGGRGTYRGNSPIKPQPNVSQVAKNPLNLSKSPSKKEIQLNILKHQSVSPRSRSNSFSRSPQSRIEGGKIQTLNQEKKDTVQSNKETSSPCFTNLDKKQSSLSLNQKNYDTEFSNQNENLRSQKHFSLYNNSSPILKSYPPHTNNLETNPPKNFMDNYTNNHTESKLELTENYLTISQNQFQESHQDNPGSFSKKRQVHPGRVNLDLTREEFNSVDSITGKQRRMTQSELQTSNMTNSQLICEIKKRIDNQGENDIQPKNHFETDDPNVSIKPIMIKAPDSEVLIDSRNNNINQNQSIHDSFFKKDLKEEESSEPEDYMDDIIDSKENQKLYYESKEHKRPSIVPQLDFKNSNNIAGNLGRVPSFKGGIRLLDVGNSDSKWKKDQIIVLPPKIPKREPKKIPKVGAFNMLNPRAWKVNR